MSFLAAIILILMVPLPAIAKESVNYKQLLEAGFSVQAATQIDNEVLFVFQRGNSVFMCLLDFKRSEAGLLNGPWNNFRTCTSLHGELEE